LTALIDSLLVGLVLLASIVYALMALGPQSWRHSIRSALGFKPSATKSAGSCGGCEGCGSDTAAPKTSAEIKIPVGKIGRR
jgi:hypothetical protein